MSDRRSGKSGPADPRYSARVAGVDVGNLAPKLRASMDALIAQWPKGTLFTLFVMDPGARGGLSYISNADRGDMIETVREWLRHQEREERE
jgi:hypothetical protein